MIALSRKSEDTTTQPCPMAGHCWHWYQGDIEFCCDCDEERAYDCNG